MYNNTSQGIIMINKKEFYKKNGIVEGKNLIVTYDDEKGGLDSYEIDQMIRRIFDL